MRAGRLLEAGFFYNTNSFNRIGFRTLVGSQRIQSSQIIPRINQVLSNPPAHSIANQAKADPLRQRSEQEAKAGHC